MKTPNESSRAKHQKRQILPQAVTGLEWRWLCHSRDARVMLAFSFQLSAFSFRFVMPATEGRCWQDFPRPSQNPDKRTQETNSLYAATFERAFFHRGKQNRRS
jgi:hypothetical protein